jgi:hypothetical protein
MRVPRPQDHSQERLDALKSVSATIEANEKAKAALEQFQALQQSQLEPVPAPSVSPTTSEPKDGSNVPAAPADGAKPDNVPGAPAK